MENVSHFRLDVIRLTAGLAVAFLLWADPLAAVAEEPGDREPGILDAVGDPVWDAPLALEKPPAPGDRYGPAISFMLLLPLLDEGDAPVAFALRGGVRYALSDRSAMGGLSDTVAGLVGVETRPGMGVGLSTQIRFELVGTRSASLVPFLYGHFFVSGGLQSTPGGIGTMSRAGFGGGWNLVVLDEQFLGCLSAAGGDLGTLLIAFGLLMGHLEIYYERIQAGALTQEGLRLGLGFAI